MQNRPLTMTLSLIFLTSIVLTTYLLITPVLGEKFTEFYILGPEGKAYDYPTNLSIGENGTVIVGIVNHEYEPTNYKLEIQFGNRTLMERVVRLGHNESLTEKFTFIPEEGGREKLEFLLYKKNSTPYRSLYLWVNVR